MTAIEPHADINPDAPPAEPIDPRRRRDAWICVGLAAITLLVFSQVRRFDFINLDDGLYIRNDRVRVGLNWENFRWAWTTFQDFYWHPLTWLSLMLDVSVYGNDDRVLAGGMHFTNALLHAAAVCLCFTALSSLTHDTPKSALVALLFAIHPLRVESVAWIAERKDCLGAVFFFLTLACYARFARSRSGLWYAATLASYALGTASKPSLVTLPCVLLLLDVWPLRRVTRGTVTRVALEKLPLFAMAAGLAVVTFIAQRRAGAVVAEYQPPVAIRAANAVLSYALYVRDTFWPVRLSAWYPHPGDIPGVRFPWGAAAVSGVVLLAVTALGAWAWRRRGEPAVLIGWFWFLGVIVPNVGLVQAGEQGRADRFTYLAHAGLLVALVWGVAALVRDRGREVRSAVRFAAVAFACFLIVTNLLYLRHWQNSYTLFTHSLSVTKNNAMASVCVAMWLTTQKLDDARAVALYQGALRIDGGSAEAHANLGSLLRDRGDLMGALRELALAGRMKPRYFEARHNLANVLADLGRTEEAIAQFKIALRLNPDSAKARYNFAVTLAGDGQYDAAIDNLQQALHFRPDDPDTRLVYALALAQAGRVDDAKGQFERVVHARPDWTEAMARFAWLLATSPNAGTRDPQTAVVVAEHANAMTLYDQPVLLDTLAAAQASAGRFEQAVAAAQRAHDLAAARGMEKFASQVGSRLALYRAGRAFVAPPAPRATTAPAATPATTAGSAP